MQIRVYSLYVGMLLAVTVLGCSKTEPEKAFSTSDVEQLLLDHPELSEPREGSEE
ncbi:hypothetical protein Poly59_18200 [Rubripirellula reticaptiva]|uniref:Uncharacterized protein n=1 Tax=Rubripirellula reticaptiva TaxID=2528013 RepID=A0A5C6F7P3_9BACT|nr:hypothetical protein Poly59_18200 [Rubripirellula reticaptiva]